MTRFVVDAPTLLDLVREGRSVPAGSPLVAPNAVRSEALALLLAEVRGGGCEEREALRLHTAMTEVKIRLLGDRVSRQTAWKLAVEHDLELRDAEYLAVTRLQADALVTVDERLAGVAEGIVPVASVDHLLT